MNTIATPTVAQSPPSTSIQHAAQVSLTDRSPASVVHLVQYDTTVPIIAVALTANGQPYTVPAGAAVNIRLAKPDGKYIYNPAYGISTNGQTAYIATTVQMTVAAGTMTPVIEVVIDGGVAATGSFTIIVDPNPVPESAIESTDEYKTIQQLAAEVQSAVDILTDNEQAINYIQQNSANITSVAQNGQSISTVAGSISDVQTVAGSISDVQTAVENIDAIKDAPAQAAAAASSASAAATSATQAQQYAQSINPAGFAPKSHADSSAQYGKATGSLYGHVKLSDAPGESGAEAGVAATPAGVRAALDAVPEIRYLSISAMPNVNINVQNAFAFNHILFVFMDFTVTGVLRQWSSVAKVQGVSNLVEIYAKSVSIYRNENTVTDNAEDAHILSDGTIEVFVNDNTYGKAFGVTFIVPILG